MKKLLLPAFFMLAGAAMPAQTTRCSSTEYQQHQLAVHPEYQQALDQEEQNAANYAQQHPNGYNNRAVVTIPVVFHVVYKTTAQNISTTRLIEQVNVLTKDYRKRNTDTGSVPAVWKPLAADCEIEFCLAKQDPSGNWTDGIERIQTTVNSFSDNGDPVKSTATGGANAWDRTKYLNIWVCNLTGGILGYASFPGGPAADDGVVIHFTAVGVTGASAPYNKGRTTTHEVGHWLNLRHIWGDDTNADGVCNSSDGSGRCNGSDQCSDTPNQCDCHYGTIAPNTVKTDDCTGSAPGTMWMNYMDYTDDGSMYMFTATQKTRIWACLNGSRAAIQTSTACMITGIAEATLKGAFAVSPNPSDGHFTLSFGDISTSNIDVTVYNVLGEMVFTRHFDAALNENQYQLDLSGNAPGVYFIEVRNAREKITRKVVVE